MSRVTSHMSHVMCHMSHVMCHIHYFYFSDNVVGPVGGGSVIKTATTFSNTLSVNHQPKAKRSIIIQGGAEILSASVAKSFAPDSPTYGYTCQQCGTNCTSWGIFTDHKKKTERGKGQHPGLELQIWLPKTHF